MKKALILLILLTSMAMAEYFYVTNPDGSEMVCFRYDDGTITCEDN